MNKTKTDYDWRIARFVVLLLSQTSQKYDK